MGRINSRIRGKKIIGLLLKPDHGKATNSRIISEALFKLQFMAADSQIIDDTWVALIRAFEAKNIYWVAIET